MRIALTGGIGSGKSYVCRLLKEKGIDVYDCDKAAKRLMRTSAGLQKALTEAVGEDVFPNGILDKALLSRFIVASETNAQKIDSVVHPAVAEDYVASGKEWLESAILFESGFHARVHFDFIVCVTASLETRLDRIMQRDSLSREKALEWINRQMPQEEKVALSDFVIDNGGEQDLSAQVDELLRKIDNNNYKLKK